MRWTKLSPLEPKKQHVGCMNCGPKPMIADMEQRIAVGFGDASLSKDGLTVWREKPNMEFEDCMTVAQAEEMAAKDPDHDWRIVLYAPLSEVEYQRHGPGQWAMIRSGLGFA